MAGTDQSLPGLSVQADLGTEWLYRMFGGVQNQGYYSHNGESNGKEHEK